MKLLVIDRRRRVMFTAQNAQEANEIASRDEIGADTIQWVIGQFGRCDGTDFTIIPEEWEELEGRK